MRESASLAPLIEGTQGEGEEEIQGETEPQIIWVEYTEHGGTWGEIQASTAKFSE